MFQPWFTVTHLYCDRAAIMIMIMSHVTCIQCSPASL